MRLFSWFKKENVSNDKIVEVLESLKKSEIRIIYQEVKGEELDVMAQINLRDVAEMDEEGLLPKTGVLSVFYDLMTMKWGYEPEDTGCARVYYFPEEVALQEMGLLDELEEDAFVPECKMVFEKKISLPGYEEYICYHENDDFDWDAYDEACVKLGYEDELYGERMKLLGYPDVIQNPMQEECEMLVRGYRTGSPEDYAKIPKDEVKDINEKSKDWILLFQMGTIETEDSEIMFGDCGHIYFWIRKQDLKERNFDNIWLILQCG